MAGGRNIAVDIETVYEYAGSQFFDPDEFCDYLAYNLNTAQHIDNYKTDVRQIADEIVAIAQDFILENGTYQDGELWRNVKWRATEAGIQLYDDARDAYGRPYSGHIEYGFTDKAGMPHGPWPFLRPAMRIGAEMSTGIIGDHMASDILYGIGNNNRIYFGRRVLDDSARMAGGRNSIRDTVRNSYGARNKVNIWQGHSKQNFGLQNKYRWREASHGINHMGKISPDVHDSFIENYGNTMSRRDFRDGTL